MIKKLCIAFIYLVPNLLFASTSSFSLTMTDESNNAKFVKLLSSEQIAAISRHYTNFKILKLCSGHFGGQSQDELVLGLWSPTESESSWKADVHRVGLIKTTEGWALHIIDDEIEKDQAISHVYPMQWKYSFDKAGFNAEMKCGIEHEFDKDSLLTFSMGDKPFFNLKQNGLENNKVTCFATDDVYNNWDCVVFNPKDNRFKLWFQQAHAD